MLLCTDCAGMADSSIATVPFALLWAAWPSEGRTALAASLGGSVAAALADPTEAASADDSLVRLSAALRASGHPVPATSIYTAGSELTDAQGFFYMRDSGQAEALLEKKLGKGRPCKSEADAMGRHGILVFRGVKRGAHGAPINHFDLWNGATTAEATCDFWHEATHDGGGGVTLFEIKKA